MTDIGFSIGLVGLSFMHVMIFVHWRNFVRAENAKDREILERHHEDHLDYADDENEEIIE